MQILYTPLVKIFTEFPAFHNTYFPIMRNDRERITQVDTSYKLSPSKNEQKNLHLLLITFLR